MPTRLDGLWVRLNGPRFLRGIMEDDSKIRRASLAWVASPMFRVQVTQYYYANVQGERNMPKILITAQVADAKKWEKGFRTHTDLFRKYTATAIDFTTTDDNDVAILWEVKDVDTYLRLMDTPETEKAMAFDGVKRETVKVFVLDKKLGL